EASGRLKDRDGSGALKFNGMLSLAELGHMANLAQRPGGFLDLNGTAKINGANQYFVDGNVHGRNVSFSSGTQRFTGIDISSPVHLDEHQLELSKLHLRAFGGELSGSATLEDFDKYLVDGQLKNFNLQSAARIAKQNIPYDGSVGGTVHASGSLKGDAAR